MSISNSRPPRGCARRRVEGLIDLLAYGMEDLEGEADSDRRGGDGRGLMSAMVEMPLSFVLISRWYGCCNDGFSCVGRDCL